MVPDLNGSAGVDAGERTCCCRCCPWEALSGLGDFLLRRAHTVVTRRFLDRRSGNYCKIGWFFFLEHTFDGVLITVCFVTEVQVEFEQAGLEPRDAIDEEFGVVDRVFLFELCEKQIRCHHRSGEIESNVEKYVGFGTAAAKNQCCSPSILTTVSLSAIFAGVRPPRGSRSAFLTQLWTVDRQRSIQFISMATVSDNTGLADGVPHRTPSSVSA